MYTMSVCGVEYLDHYFITVRPILHELLPAMYGMNYYRPIEPQDLIHDQHYASVQDRNTFLINHIAFYM